MTEAARVLVAGATGYIGRHVVAELVRRQNDVIALARERAGVGGALDAEGVRAALPGARVLFADVTRGRALAEGLREQQIDAVISCLASRTGTASDAWRIDHDAQRALLAAARAAGARHFVLLSAICVQRPRLEFQRAKLAFEATLKASGLRYSIVRPTAFFKSLSGQVERVREGKPFVVFGDGTGTACLPISERDLAVFLVDCLTDPVRFNAVLPVGGPGPPLTPRDQARLLEGLLGRPVPIRRVPLRLMDAVVAILGALSRVVPSLADKAELARIGRYYATESMLVWDEQARMYSAAATPTFGADTLESFYARALAHGLVGQELGAHRVFASKI